MSEKKAAYNAEELKDYQTIAFAPQDAANIAEQKAKELAQVAHKGIEFPIPEIASYPFAPLLPGQLCVVLAQSSNYKSGFMDFWKDQIAAQLDRQDRDDEAVFYVSVEDMLEEQMFFELSKETGFPVDEISTGHAADWSRVIDATVKIGGIQVYRICNSLTYSDRKTPELFLTNIDKAIEMVYLRDKKKPAVIFVDYLQALPLDPEHLGYGSDARRLQVRADIYQMRMMSARYSCPVIVGVQAKQELQGASGEYMYIPGMYDGEETSSIAQRTDRMISLWMPKQKHGAKINQTVKSGDQSYIVRENLLFVKVAKQRGRLPAGKTWSCMIGFTRNKIVSVKLEDTYIDKQWSEKTDTLNR